jgi:transcriptional regulator with XRE-family HTH domain
MAVKLFALRTLRERALMTQEDLAEAASIHRVTLANLERLANGAHPVTIRSLAKALHCQPSDLMQEPSHE